MKQVIFLSAAAVITAAAFFLFRQGRKKAPCHPPIMTFKDLYEDSFFDTS